MRSLLVLVAILAVPAVVAADAVPLEADACAGKQAGDPCALDGQDGACVASTCSRLDYSGGTPPRSVPYDCVVCSPGTAPSAPPAGGCAITSRGGAGWSILPVAIAALVLARRRRGDH